MEMRDNPIAIKNLSHSYPDGTSSLNGINLSVQEGERVALIGANGSGKSTLQFHLNEIFLPQSGHIKVGQWEVNSKNLIKIRNFVGLVFQNPYN